MPIVNLQVRPGMVLGIDRIGGIAALIVDADRYLLATYFQENLKYVRPGQTVEVAFDLYPGQIFKGRVNSIWKANGVGQYLPSDEIPKFYPQSPDIPQGQYGVKILLDDPYSAKFPIGAQATAAIYTGGERGAWAALRKISIRAHSWANWLYPMPFRAGSKGEPNLSANSNLSANLTAPAPSRWGAFGSVAFTVIWTASVLSNLGTAMFDTASGWLITSLDANPMTVSLVQVAVSLPLFLFTLPAGALADVIDLRRLLIAVELAILAVSVIFAGLVSFGVASSALLLSTTFLLGVGGALTSPAWGSTIPLLVPKQDLDSATAMNGAGFNIGRAAGPALGGLIIAAAGVAVPFWIFAASNLVVIAALIWWRKPRNATESLPAERLPTRSAPASATP